MDDPWPESVQQFKREPPPYLGLTWQELLRDCDSASVKSIGLYYQLLVLAILVYSSTVNSLSTNKYIPSQVLVRDQLRDLRRIRYTLDFKTAATIASSLVHSNLFTVTHHILTSRRVTSPNSRSFKTTRLVQSHQSGTLITSHQHSNPFSGIHWLKETRYCIQNICISHAEFTDPGQPHYTPQHFLVHPFPNSKLFQTVPSIFCDHMTPSCNLELHTYTSPSQSNSGYCILDLALSFLVLVTAHLFKHPYIYSIEWQS